LPGATAMSARVVTQDATSPFAGAGVMIRQDADAQSPYYALLVKPGVGTVVEYRSVRGLRFADPIIPAAAPPAYLKVARSGDVFAAFTSADGAHWTAIPGSVAHISIEGPVLAG